MVAKLQTAMATWRLLMPGFFLAAMIAAAAGFLSQHYGAPVMLFALLIGMAFHFLAIDDKCAPGVEFTAKRMLRFGVALLGFRVTLDQILGLGIMPLILVPGIVVVTIAVGYVIARAFGRQGFFSLLSAGAVAICGASAALAIASVLPQWRDKERDVLFTVISVTSLSTVAMILYPVLFRWFGFEPLDIGILLGATIHDVAQVVGAGYAVSEDAGDIATFIKLLRVAMLPLVVLTIALLVTQTEKASGQGGQSSFPWFAVGFAVLLGINSTGVVPPVMVEFLSDLSRWMLVIAIAALGVKTSLKSMLDVGRKSIMVVVLQTLFLMGLVVAIAAMGLFDLDI